MEVPFTFKSLMTCTESPALSVAPLLSFTVISMFNLLNITLRSALYYSCSLLEREMDLPCFDGHWVDICIRVLKCR